MYIYICIYIYVLPLRDLTQCSSTTDYHDGWNACTPLDLTKRCFMHAKICEFLARARACVCVFVFVCVSVCVCVFCECRRVSVSCVIKLCNNPCVYVGVRVMK